MGKVTALRCVTCRREHDPAKVESTCPHCGPRRGTLEVLYDYPALRRTLSRASFEATGLPGMWRYLPILPITDATRVQPLTVGMTPLYSFSGLAHELGLGALLVKDDGRNPTASYKDRASAVVVIVAQERGKKVVTCASTGNAASSLAGFVAATSLETAIFVPRTAPEAKVAQLLVYGATVYLVRGSYDQAFDLALEAADAFGWYNRSAGVNPYLVEGKKTGAFEVIEQLGWDSPDAVFVSVGDGSVISGICKGFAELRLLGLLDRIPQVIGVQAEGASPVAAAYAGFRGGAVEWTDTEANTVADSISVGKPRDIVKAIPYLWENKGRKVTVSDEEILDAIAALARRAGVFAEPAGAAAFAGLVKLSRSGDLAGKRAVVMVTGSALKDVAAARRAARARAVEIDPSLTSLVEARR